MQAALGTLFADPIAAEQALDKSPEEWDALVTEARQSALGAFLDNPTLKASRGASGFYEGAEGDRMEETRRAALSALAGLDAARGTGTNPKSSFEALDSIRLVGGKKGSWGEGELGAVKEALKTVRELARAELKHGIATLELGPADERLAEVLPVLWDAHRAARQFVSAAKRRVRVLGFADYLPFLIRFFYRSEREQDSS